MTLSPSYEPVGVIDIGSNSVRLVVFDGLKRHVRPIFNEKILCGLGENLATSGRLPEDGKREAAACFGRYVRLARALPVASLRVLATAAIRDAEDGPAFMRELSERYQVPIDIVPGEEEARLAALGVLATIHEPRGLAGDLGGGSLELIAISPDTVAERISLPLGVLRLWKQGDGHAHAIRKLIDRQLEDIPWLRRGGYPRFYAIGGSFRMLARVHMRRTDYPLRLLHQYTVGTRELRKFTDDMLRLNLHAIASLKGMPAERAHMLMPGLLVLERTMELAGCEEAVFCTGGIREGLLYDDLPPDVQRQDPLLAYTLDYLPNARATAYAEAVFNWMKPLRAIAPEIPERLIEAFCHLSDAAIDMHPEYRAQWAYDLVLYSACNGLTHGERVWLALAMYHRYRAKRRIDEAFLGLISESGRASARLFGIGAALAYALSGGATALLAEVALEETGGSGGSRITLKSASEAFATDAETLEKLLDGLGESVKALDKRLK